MVVAGVSGSSAARQAMLAGVALSMVSEPSGPTSERALAQM
jgi:hypothetical protein